MKVMKMAGLSNDGTGSAGPTTRGTIARKGKQKQLKRLGLDWMKLETLPTMNETSTG